MATMNLTTVAAAPTKTALSTAGTGNGVKRKLEDPQAILRRYVRQRLGVSDVRKATPEQIKALQAKGLLPGAPATRPKQASSQAAALMAVQAKRTTMKAV